MRSVVTLLLFLCSPAAAIDGAREINQVCAVETGCFPGDDPGFPVTISAGSFILTSNLGVVQAGVNGIELPGSGTVVLDLKGFKIEGSGSPSLAGITGDGEFSQTLVRNGTVSNFNSGILLSGSSSSVVNVRVFSFYSTGISAQRVENCLVDEGSKSHTGIVGNVVTNNRVVAGSPIEGRGSGVPGALVEGNNVSGGSVGISSSGRVVGNRIISDGIGISLSPAGVSSGNLIQSGAAPLVGGFDQGGNVCNGVVCPAITALKLRNANTNNLVKLVENDDTYSLASIGGCIAIQVEVNESSSSLRYDWKPPGGSLTVAYRSENNEPFCFASDLGWASFPEIANCGCSSEMAQLGSHQLVLTPCSVNVNFGLGETCAGNGGVDGRATSVSFTIAP